VGSMYSNAPAAYPYPAKIFDKGRGAGALTGFAHFHGSMAHSTLPMDLALGNLDFLEVFQFGKLWAAEWYELLNAGFRVTGIAGSDFPVPLGRAVPWPKWLPLLGPERTLVKGRAGASAYESWANGIRNGVVTVSNGPIVEIETAGATVRARAEFFRPIERIEIIRNGEIVASAANSNAVAAPIPQGESAWFAARAVAKKEEGEPEIQAHTNPVYVLHENRPVRAAGAREAYARRWAAEIEYYKSAKLPFATAAERDEFFAAAGRALDILRK